MNGQEFHLCRILPFHNPCATNINTARGLQCIFPLLGRQDGRRCKWVLWNGESTNWRNTWLTNCCSSFKYMYENDILKPHKRKPSSKVVIWGGKMTATLWQCTCGARESKLVDPSPRMQHANSTVAFEMNEGAWIVKRPYRVIQVMMRLCTITIMYLTWTYTYNTIKLGPCVLHPLWVKGRSRSVGVCFKFNSSLANKELNPQIHGFPNIKVLSNLQEMHRVIIMWY